MFTNLILSTTSFDLLHVLCIPMCVKLAPQTLRQQYQIISTDWPSGPMFAPLCTSSKDLSKRCFNTLYNNGSSQPLVERLTFLKQKSLEKCPSNFTTEINSLYQLSSIFPIIVFFPVQFNVRNTDACHTTFISVLPKISHLLCTQ